MKQAPIIFPDPILAGEDGLLCAGGDLKTETLLNAYSRGIFPWPQEDLPLLWFFPWNRGVLDFNDLHWPRRFLRELKKDDVRITFNRAFEEVIQNCAAVSRSHEKGTWILSAMKDAYVEFHKAGYAHSVEAWRDDKLIGGLYGVYVEGVFSGESMFHKESGASKRCLHALAVALQKSGVQWMDIQMVTPVLETFGGKYISREEYLKRLQLAHENPRKLISCFDLNDSKT